MAKKSNDLRNVLTPSGRASYPSVFKPKEDKKSTRGPHYSLTLLIPKDEDMGEIKAAIRAAKEDKWGKDESQWPKMSHPPIKDGDKPKFADKDGHAGCWILKATCGVDTKPSVVDENVKPIIDQAKFYPGCWARAHIRATAYDNEYGQGVTFILDHVQKTGDDKSFAGKKDANEVFTSVNAGQGASNDGEDDFE